jgi:hypothetical protein
MFDNYELFKDQPIGTKHHYIKDNFISKNVIIKNEKIFSIDGGSIIQLRPKKLKIICYSPYQIEIEDVFCEETLNFFNTDEQFFIYRYAMEYRYSAMGYIPKFTYFCVYTYPI